MTRLLRPALFIPVVSAAWFAALLLLASIAGAQLRVPSEPNIVTARFPSGATTVAVDVIEVGGAQLANDVAATRVQLDAANTDLWQINLAALPGYPVNCEPRTYLVRFNPDTSNCSTAGTPEVCVAVESQVGGADCDANPSLQVSYVYAAAVVTAQGITQKVRDHFNRRGTEPVRWRKIEVAQDKNFASPDYVKWEVYFYGESTGTPRLTCTVDTETDPAGGLPSSASCAGN